MDERLRRNAWEVRDADIGVARRLVTAEHYSRGASNTATYLHGLWPADEFWAERCQGVAWWIPPTRSAAEATYPPNWKGVLALSRLAITPATPKNAASFLIAGSRRRIDRERWPCLVSYADEWQGHTGAIYLADNWRFVGKTKPERVYVRNGRMVARKAGQRTRTHAEMLALGAECVGEFPRLKFVHIVEPRPLFPSRGEAQ